ncbi:MAG TPA: hypothetical protein VG817_10580, partial [Gemmatimonadales bacterium]|nr:hypothetical protein [Gemmatimonadales bacterium]
MRKMTKLAALAVVVAFGVNCGGDDGPTGPKAGTLTVELETPFTDDAAIKLTITGPEALTSITAANPDIRVFQTGTLGTTNTVIITGTIEAGDILKIGVADTRKHDDYSATVEQVASTT